MGRFLAVQGQIVSKSWGFPRELTTEPRMSDSSVPFKTRAQKSIIIKA